jgi:D-aminopeptidase
MRVPTAAVAGDPVTVKDDAATSPRMTGVLVSEALPLDPPHPARSITAHMAAIPAAFVVFELDRKLANRLVRASIANTIPLGDVVP